MIEFLLGLFVLAMMGVFSLVVVLLFPVLLLLGVFLRLVIGFVICFFFIWLVGKATLLLIESLRKPK